jgi:hypothetical protein
MLWWVEHAQVLGTISAGFSKILALMERQLVNSLNVQNCDPEDASSYILPLKTSSGRPKKRYGSLVWYYQP